MSSCRPGRRGRCPGSELKGSGYVKPENTALSQENQKRMDELLAARAAQDAKWAAAWTSAPQSNQKQLTDVRAGGSTYQ